MSNTTPIHPAVTATFNYAVTGSARDLLKKQTLSLHLRPLLEKLAKVSELNELEQNYATLEGGADILQAFGIDTDMGESSLEVDFDRKAGVEKQPIPANIRIGLQPHFEQEIAEARKLFGGAAENWN